MTQISNPISPRGSELRQLLFTATVQIMDIRLRMVTAPVELTNVLGPSLTWWLDRYTTYAQELELIQPEGIGRDLDVEDNRDYSLEPTGGING